MFDEKFWLIFWVIIAVTIISIVKISTSYIYDQNKLVSEAKSCESAVILQGVDVSNRLIICRLSAVSEKNSDQRK